MDDLIYNDYLKEGEIFFAKATSKNSEKSLEIINVPKNYEIIYDKENYWKYYHINTNKLPSQGWKIHISADISEINKVLEKVSQIAFDYKICFKHLKSEQKFYLNNTKNTPRSSSGKFIVLYPINNEQFVELLYKLEKQLSSFKKGPYILSDKRWKNSNVYYRYGAFVSKVNNDGDLCILDEEGNLIIDQRKPYYVVPSVANEFNNYLESINTSNHFKNDSTGQAKFDKYNFLEAFSFTNSGGVYIAEDKVSKRKVIIKEARSNTGFDGNMNTAIDRQRSEYEALCKLKNIPSVVNVLDYFKFWEHEFIVEEYIEGETLHRWIAKNFPFLKYEDKTIYEENVISIIDQLIETINRMHKKGIVMGDLQPNNILVTDNLNIKLIDFETATQINDTPSIGLAVPTFSNTQVKSNQERDLYALKKIIKFILIPTYTTKELDDFLIPNHLSWISNNYSSKIQEKLKEIDYTFLTKKVEHRSISLNVNDKILKFKKFLDSNLKDDIFLTNNDPKQFFSEVGRLNINSGGFGILWLYHNLHDYKNNKIQKWLKSIKSDLIMKLDDVGLFSGKAGIAVTLYEYGYKDTAEKILLSLSNSLPINNISLNSGISGVGVALLSLYLVKKDNRILKQCFKIATILKDTFNDEKNKHPLDLINGWAGASLFLSLLYKHTKIKSFISLSKTILCYVVDCMKEDKRTLQIFDEYTNSLLPYLSNGSIGVGVSIKLYQETTNDNNTFKRALNKILNLEKVRITLSGGLFNGAAGFLLLSIINKQTRLYDSNQFNPLSLIDLFTTNYNNKYYYAGEYSYRFSFDFFSGLTGAILSLLSFNNNSLYLFIPSINNEELFY